MKQFESFGLDTRNECLWQNGIQIALAPKPFAVLRYLVENPGRLITHNELLDALWPETYVQPQVLRTYMLELRKVLGDDAGQPRFIQTLPKRGYQFVATLSEGTSAHRELPQRAVPQTASPLAGIVGRDDELARLEGLAGLVNDGRRQVVFVTGGVGIGKTALVDAFSKRMENPNAAHVACGQCVEGLGKKEDYYPVMEVLSQLCASRLGKRLRDVLIRMAPAWLPALERTADSPAGSARTAGDLCAALEQLSHEDALVLVFEDLHWADNCTVELISALARRRSAAKLMVISTYRPFDGSYEHPLRAMKQDLLMHRLCGEMALGPLPKTAVRALLRRELVQDELPEGLDGFIYLHSEGNPLFALALLQHLIARRFLVRNGSDESGEWKQLVPFPEMEAGVPDELAQLIELEIDRLDAQDQRILEAASLINVAFPAWAVAAALGQNPAETEEACDELARRLSFVHHAGHDDLPDGTRSDFYAFGHGLYREVLYQRQAAARRSRGHTRIANRLGEMFAGRGATVAREMAMHYESAGNWQRAATALRAAARHAWQRHSCSEAAQLVDRTLAIGHNLSDEEREVLEREIHDEFDVLLASAESSKCPPTGTAKNFTFSG